MVKNGEKSGETFEGFRTVFFAVVRTPKNGQKSGVGGQKRVKNGQNRGSKNGQKSPKRSKMVKIGVVRTHPEGPPGSARLLICIARALVNGIKIK